MGALRIAPPAETPPIEWMALPILPVEDLAAAETVVQYYPYHCCVKRYHYVLKSGCHMEGLQLETFDRLDRALAVYGINAWRLRWWTYQAREPPEQSCTPGLASGRMGRVRCPAGRWPDPPPAPVELRTAVRGIAQLRRSLGVGATANPGSKRFGAAIGVPTISRSCGRYCTRRNDREPPVRGLTAPRTTTP